MRAIFKTASLLCLLFFTSSLTNAFVVVPMQPFAEAVRKTESAFPSPFASMTVTDFLLLTPKKYKLLTGKKLSFSQKISLKIVQFKVKRMVQKKKPVDLVSMAREIDTSNFDILGFILGVALGPLGVLIAYLIEGKGSSTFTWSIIGGLIWLGVFLLVVLVL